MKIYDEEDGFMLDPLAPRSIRDMQAEYKAAAYNREEYRSDDPSHNVLCRYINEHQSNELVTTGCVGTSQNIVPLHVTSVVSGYTQRPIAANASSTT